MSSNCKKESEQFVNWNRTFWMSTQFLRYYLIFISGEPYKFLIPFQGHEQRYGHRQRQGHGKGNGRGKGLDKGELSSSFFLCYLYIWNIKYLFFTISSQNSITNVKCNIKFIFYLFGIEST